MKLSGKNSKLEVQVPVHWTIQFVTRYVCFYCNVAYVVAWYGIGWELQVFALMNTSFLSFRLQSQRLAGTVFWACRLDSSVPKPYSAVSPLKNNLNTHYTDRFKRLKVSSALRKYYVDGLESSRVLRKLLVF
jgi:hypothetical protein